MNNTDIAQKVTVRQLLNHTSGLPSMLLADDQVKVTEPTSMIEQVNAIAMKQLTHDPGQTYSYGNANAVFLGAIIEKVTGQTYIDYVTENIFKKLDMNNSGFFYTEHFPPEVVSGTFTDHSGAVQSTKEIFNRSLSPALSLYASVNDLQKLSSALFDKDSEFNQIKRRWLRILLSNYCQV